MSVGHLDICGKAKANGKPDNTPRQKTACRKAQHWLSPKPCQVQVRNVNSWKTKDILKPVALNGKLPIWQVDRLFGWFEKDKKGSVYATSRRWLVSGSADSCYAMHSHIMHKSSPARHRNSYKQPDTTWPSKVKRQPTAQKRLLHRLCRAIQDISQHLAIHSMCKPCPVLELVCMF